jgi:hypothetical protein
VEARPPALRAKGRLKPPTVTLAGNGARAAKRYTYICILRSDHSPEAQPRRCPDLRGPT